MIVWWFLASVVLTFLAVLLAMPDCVQMYNRYRRNHFVACPENSRECTIEISAGLAATTSALLPTQLHITHCSLWPKMRHCRRRCLLQMTNHG